MHEQTNDPSGKQEHTGQEPKGDPGAPDAATQSDACVPQVRQGLATEWLRGQGHLSDVVLSSRVRAARNLAGFPFPPHAESSDRAQILEICKRCIDQIGSIEDSASMRWIDLRESPALERRLLVERQIMSRQHELGRSITGEGGVDAPRGLAVYEPDERISVLVNEEDHLRIQVIRAGLNLSQSLAEVNQIDDKIEMVADYAFHPRFGYLTACPTNVGTGLRLSVMMHLPALGMSGELEKVRNAANDMGLAIRGLYGEGSEAAGGFFQVSNQVTLGKSDEMLLREIEDQIVPMIVQYEQHARNQLLERRRSLVEDKVHRALGTLQSARLIQTNEALEHLGAVRFGVLCGLIEGISLQLVHSMLLQIQPGHLQVALGQELDQSQRREARATMLRSRMSAASR